MAFTETALVIYKYCLDAISQEMLGRFWHVGDKYNPFWHHRHSRIYLSISNNNKWARYAFPRCD